TALTRAEFVKAIWRGAGSPEAGVNPFTDASPDDAPLAWAYETGLIVGYGDGSFGPDDVITREQINIVLERLSARDRNRG
ncbi:MAG: S-layer homology domain-containing protein, partial [Oscillospiraceae bacterium]|nr:S-layer homology domain-containing protein [Oscillospiraceae bacterium]